MSPTPAESSAPAKLILCGEHAVVYGRPAIAFPLADVRASAAVAPAPPRSGLRFVAPDLAEAWRADERADHPLVELATLTLARLGAPRAPDVTVTLRSAIPLASGMGSGAAIGTAMVRALARSFGKQLDPATVAALVYTSEQRYHGTPSGLDNTVVAYERPIWFVRGEPPTLEPLTVGAAFTLLVGDTGVRSETRLPVAAVRAAWSADSARYEAWFDDITAVAQGARSALAAGDAPELGRLLDRNQMLLEQIGVSSAELAGLIAAAREAGALGAKLSGAGWGGVMLALVTPERAADVAEALRAAGATRVLETILRR